MACEWHATRTDVHADPPGLVATGPEPEYLRRRCKNLDQTRPQDHRKVSDDGGDLVLGLSWSEVLILAVVVLAIIFVVRIWRR
jgi:hypothetical protein